MMTFAKGERFRIRSEATRNRWVAAEVLLASSNMKSIALEVEEPVFMRDYLGNMAIAAVIPLSQSDGGFEDLMGGSWEVAR